MMLKHKLVLGGLIFIVVFAGIWQLSYGYVLDPEQAIETARSHNGRDIARENSWSYLEIHDFEKNPEYGHDKEEIRQNYDNFLGLAKTGLGNNRSVLIAAFSRENYPVAAVREEYWLVAKAGDKLMVSKVLEPAVLYPMKLTEWGPNNFFSFAWKSTISDAAVLFTKPTKVAGAGFRIMEFVAFVITVVGLIMFGIIFTFIAVMCWLAWPDKKRKTAYSDKKAE